MASELEVNALIENTTDNGINIDSLLFSGSILIQDENIPEQTIASGKNALIIGPAKCPNKLTVVGKVQVVG
tara:strand:+ start:3150 stop:3362 length:213 start_codon:yes stop_codon:yes gene_type:complete